MTRIVDGLIKEGLAERRPHPSDGRAVTVIATEAGEALMRIAQRRCIDAIVAALQTLPPGERAQLTAAAGLLDQVAAAVRSGQGREAIPGPSR